MPACQFKTWFVSKRYGYGAGIPICWQGWLSVGVLAAAIGTAVLLLSGGRSRDSNWRQHRGLLGCVLPQDRMWLALALRRSVVMSGASDVWTPVG